MLRIARDRPFPSAKLSKHLEYRRAVDIDRVNDMVSGWCFAVMVVCGALLFLAFMVAAILGKL